LIDEINNIKFTYVIYITTDKVSWYISTSIKLSMILWKIFVHATLYK